MKHFRNLILTITIILCATTSLSSAKPRKIINMKIDTTHFDAAKQNAFPKPYSRFARSNAVPTEESKIMRIIDVHQSPKMLGNERGAKLHIASGAYPVYYGIARANGRFGKHIYALNVNE